MWGQPRRSIEELFLLNGLQVFGDCVQPYFSPVLVRLDFMEDRPPHWHLAIAVGEHSRCFSFNDRSYTLVRELPAASLRDSSQVRNRML